MRLIRKFDQALARLEQGLIVVLFSALIVLITFNIVGRNFLDLSFQQLLEVIPALVMWLALLGASLALKHRRHIKLEVLLRYLGPAAGKAARSVTGVCGALLMGLLFAASLTFVKNEIGIFGGWGWISVIFPLFFALATVRFIISVMPADGRAPGPHRPASDRPGDAARGSRKPSEAS
jgi:TRAP-type C4-dicarboxylate transport system permease small subunit